MPSGMRQSVYRGSQCTDERPFTLMAPQCSALTFCRSREEQPRDGDV